MDVTRVLLHRGWEFAFAPSDAIQQPEDCHSLSFHPATVPGTNLTDLQAAGLVEPDTSATYEDSFAPYAEMDFIYRCRFQGGGIAGKKHLYLCCDGLDTVCLLYLNGERIGYAENAHLGYRFDVAGRVQPEENELLLVFRSPKVEAARRRARYGHDLPAPHGGDFAYIRKPAYSFFWDWGPKMPVSGIYKDLYLQGYDRAEIRDYHVRYAIEYPRACSPVPGEDTLSPERYTACPPTATATFSSGPCQGESHQQGQKVTGTVEVHVTGEVLGGTVRVRLAGSEFTAPLQKTGGRRRKCAEVVQKAVVPFTLPEVRLWYPNGEGEPYLYDLKITLEGEGEVPEVLDERRQRLGFRTIELVREPRRDGRGSRFLFKVNGREVFMRGYNWIPVDNSLPRGYGRLYRGNLDLAQRGNVNMLRVWGGGYYETDEFYQLCDERGILVWQDGMFACALYPDDDPAFLDLVRQELTYNIVRLRNVTSLALWCGENENHWGYEEWWTDHVTYPRFCGTAIYDELFPALVRELDPDRPYWNGSPYSAEPGVRANDPFHGDTHFWDLHSNCGDFWHYRQSAPSFVSETGIQSLPDLRTALTIGTAEDRHVQSFVFDTRNHFENPAKNERLLKFTGALFRVSGQFDEAIIRSNLAHGEYLKYAVEHWRSQAYDCGGVLIWQINDCWPAISWAAIDYNLQPKACWYYLRRAFAPDLVGYLQNYAIDYDPEANARGELFVASEREGSKTGTVEMQVMTVTGEELEVRHYPVALEGRGTVSLGPVELPGYRERRFGCLVRFTLRWEDGTTARNIYTYSRPKHMHLPEPQIRALQLAPDRFKLRSDIFAKGVYLYHKDSRVIFDDNYFDLLPGEEKTIIASVPVQIAEVKAIAYHH